MKVVCTIILSNEHISRARGDTYPDRHPARLDNLKFSAFFPKRANVIVASYSPRAAHSVLIHLCTLLLITGYLLQHDDCYKGRVEIGD